MQIWVQKEGQNYGPFSPEDLSQHVTDGAFSANDFGWYEGNSDWAPLNQIPSLSFTAPTSQAIDPEPHANNAVENREDIAQLRFDLHRVKAELEEVRSRESTVREELEQEKQQANNDRLVSGQTIQELNEQVLQHTATDQSEIDQLKHELQQFQELQMEPPEILAMANKLNQLEALLSGSKPPSATQQSPQGPVRISLTSPEPALRADTEAPEDTFPPPSEVPNPLRVASPNSFPPPSEVPNSLRVASSSASPPPPSAASPQPELYELGNPAPVQLLECGERTYPSMQELINAASAGQKILGIFTSKKIAPETTIDVKSEELLHGRKLTAKERYLGTKEQLKAALIFLAFFCAILVQEMIIGLPSPLGEIVDGLIAAAGMCYAYLVKGVRKFPDSLIITENDLVVLTGIEWNTKDGLHKFDEGIRILRRHAHLKKVMGQSIAKNIRILVYSGEKGVLGNNKEDVIVTLNQSSRFFPGKEKKVLGDQLLDYKKAQEILEASPPQPIFT